MRKLVKNVYGSIAPIVIFLLTLSIVGLVGGILDVFIQVVRTDETSMDVLMGSAWYFVFFVIFIVLASWVHMVAQKRGFTGY